MKNLEEGLARWMRAIGLVSVLFLIGAASACEEKGPLEELGEKADEAVEEVADEIDDATDGR